MFDQLLSTLAKLGRLPTAGAECDVRELILSGRAPEQLEISGTLDLSNSARLRRLPSGLRVDSLDLSNCTALTSLPSGLRLKFLKLDNCSALTELPADLQCDVLEFRNSPLQRLPTDLRVVHRLELSGSRRLESLPEGLQVARLVLRDCERLQALPERLDVFSLDITGCTALRDWPTRGKLRYGFLHMRGCSRLRSLPAWLGKLSQLDLRDCSGLESLPATLKVDEWVDLAGTGIAGLPPSLRELPLRWRGVPVDERVAFRPATITAGEIVDERNVERRRVLLERMGYTAFLSQAEAVELDRDEDPGGERRLLKVPQPRDQDLVCLAVYCPSTGRQYVLRVPPTTSTCRQAAAWLAGFDNADDFQPVAET